MTQVDTAVSEQMLKLSYKIKIIITHYIMLSTFFIQVSPKK